jgi:carbonic anhydrase/acetyltransferase-like protein (isoleucine patch superfamily)
MVDIGATVMDGAVVSHGAMLGPGSLLLEGQRIPSGELWAGSPAQFVRKLTEEEIKSIPQIATKYRELAQVHDEYHMKSQSEIQQAKEDVYDRKLVPEFRPAHRY